MASKTGKTLVQFNVKNGQFKTDSGTMTDLTWLTSISLDKELAKLDLYGDGELVVPLISDKGFVGTLGMTAKDDALEKENGMTMEVTGGVADIAQQSIKDNSIYFETEFVGADGIKKTKKVWLFGVNISSPSESLEQTTENINISNIEYPITVKGVNLKATGGTADYVDVNTGNTIKVFKLSAVPTDTGYANFGDSVPVPTQKTSE